MAKTNDDSVSDLKTINQKINFVVGLLVLPALSLLVFLRFKLGLRQVPLIKINGIGVFVMILPIFGSSVPKVHDISLTTEGVEGYFYAFGLAVILAGAAQRWYHTRLLTQGKLWHSYSLGRSWFEYILPFIPAFWVRAAIDPLFALIVSVIVSASFSPLLGGWIMWGAIGIFSFEMWVRDQQFNQLLDMVDSLCDSEVQSYNANSFTGSGEQSTATQKPPSIEETAGIPTGIAPDIEAQINRRRNRKPPPDDLAG